MDRRIEKVMKGNEKMFKALREPQLGSAVESSIELATASQKALFDGLRPLIEQNLAPLATAVAFQTSKLLAKIPKGVFDDLQVINSTFRKAMASIDFSAIEKTLKAFDDLPERVKNQLLVLGKNGWYIDLEMGVHEVFEIQEALEAGRQGEVDQFLVEHYDSNLNRIEELCIGLYPKREKIVRKAISAHRNRDYELSVPVLLVQADGIVKENTGFNLFVRDKRRTRPAAADYVDALASETISKALLSPLTEILPIMKSESERGETFMELNRHLVLHGESCDYGNSIFAAKSVSLLNYLCQVFKKSSA